MRLLFDALQELGPRLGFGETAKFLELLMFLPGQLGQLTLLVLNRAGTVAQGILLFTKPLLGFEHARELGINEGFALGEAVFLSETLGAAGCQSLIDFEPEFADLFPGGQPPIADDDLRIRARFGQDRFGLEHLDLFETAAFPPQEQITRHGPRRYKRCEFKKMNQQTHSRPRAG
jgi:hypothetical protein